MPWIRMKDTGQIIEVAEIGHLTGTAYVGDWVWFERHTYELVFEPWLPLSDVRPHAVDVDVFLLTMVEGPQDGD